MYEISAPHQNEIIIIASNFKLYDGDEDDDGDADDKDGDDNDDDNANGDDDDNGNGDNIVDGSQDSVWDGGWLRPNFKPQVIGEMKYWYQTILVIFDSDNIGDIINIGIIQPYQTIWVIFAQT